MKMPKSSLQFSGLDYFSLTTTAVSTSSLGKKKNVSEIFFDQVRALISQFPKTCQVLSSQKKY